MDGLFLRGGVATRRHFENERMIFSEGLVSAYELETLARWPRTLVHESVEALALTDPLIRKDPCDGRRFVDYLEYCSYQQSAPGEHRKHAVSAAGQAIWVI
jgi:hypothetical protein